MDRIKGVKEAFTLQCRGAVTKEAVDAVLSGSSDASYRQINIHSVKTAGTLKEPVKTAGMACNAIFTTHKAPVYCVHADMPGYRNVDNNLTIEELFSGTGRNFR
ncbi:MAG: hypothetical protein HFH68_14840 [Lachnospiraceae bacterium]|nr:hypothetical protein [Lachnospiraceae bacterium]